MTEEREVFVAKLTPDEYAALGDGESIQFEYPGGIIEQDPVFVVEATDE